jgi:hypothetical protein
LRAARRIRRLEHVPRRTWSVRIVLKDGPSLALYDCLVFGGNGGDSDDFGGDGGPGVHASNAFLFASGTQVRGGKGGDASGQYGFWYGGDGGAGMVFGPATTGIALASGFFGGPGGYQGGAAGPPSVGGSLAPLAGKASKLSLPAIVSDGQQVSLAISGSPGDMAFLLLTTSAGFQFSAVHKGVAATVGNGPTVQLDQPTPIGIVLANGVLNTQVQFPALPHAVPGRRYFLQSFVVDGMNNVTLGSPRHVLCLNDDSRPDCNANGIQDYWEILMGLVPDTNQNWIPDPCPGG